MGIPNVCQGEYSDFYIYHLVVYPPYVWLITLSFMYINVQHTSSFRGGGKRDDLVDIYIHNNDTEMVNMKVYRQKRLLFLLLFSVQTRWRDIIRGQQAKLSGRAYSMEMPNVCHGEYSDFYIYHLVVYIPYVWLITLSFYVYKRAVYIVI